MNNQRLSNIATAIFWTALTIEASAQSSSIDFDNLTATKAASAICSGNLTSEADLLSV